MTEKPVLDNLTPLTCSENGEMSDDAIFQRLESAVDAICANLAKRSPDVDSDMVRRSYLFARDSHGEQRRKDGKPYITHPVEVTEILSELEMDEHTLAAGLLHDVVEDCGVTVEEIKAAFGEQVAALVDGVTKLTISGVDEGKLPDENKEEVELSQATKERLEKQAEMIKNANNLRKLFVAMARDLRVMIIKLADRLHNMRTLASLSQRRQYRMATETLHIFAPLAHRLGIWQLKWELEDLSFKYVDPEAYERTEAKVERTRADRQNEVAVAIATLQKALEDENIKAHITGRPKHLYSIYNKMMKQKLDITEIYDLVAIRVIVHTRPECYSALGVVSNLWHPIPGQYTDYIAQTKANMYQSIHLKVMGPNNTPLEVQIRTWEMHRTAEFGVAAHWQYKEGGKVTDRFETQLAFLRKQLFDLQAENRDPRDFMQQMGDIFDDQIFVHTPKGDIIDLPVGSTALDFAYRVHSDVGSHCAGAKVNGKMQPISDELKTGDVVQILTRPSCHPSRDWLGFVKSHHARARINSYLKRVNREEHIQRGREMLERELALQLEREPKEWGEEPRSLLLRDDSLRRIAPFFNVSDEQGLLSGIGYGSIPISRVLNRLKPTPVSRPEPTVQVGNKRADDSKLIVSAEEMDTSNVLYRRSRCCLPIPGDDIIGYVTRGKGMVLHRSECLNLQQLLLKEAERCQAINFVGNEKQVYQIVLTIESLDRINLLADVTNIFGENRTNITAIHTQSHKDKTATLEVSLECRNTDHLNMIMMKLHHIREILDIRRGTSSKVKQGAASNGAKSSR